MRPKHYSESQQLNKNNVKINDIRPKDCSEMCCSFRSARARIGDQANDEFAGSVDDGSCFSHRF